MPSLETFYVFAVQTLALGLTFNLIALVGDTIVALTAGTAAVRLRSALRSRRVAQASGVAYISLGLWAALGNSRAKA